MSGTKKGLIAIILVNIIWGMDFIVIEYMMHHMDPLSFMLTRIIASTVFLTIIVLVRGKGFHIDKKDLPRVFLSGAVGMSLYFNVENAGTGLTSASFSAVILATVPIYGLLSDCIFFGKKITPVKSLCTLFSIVGVYLLVAGEPMGTNVRGFVFMLLAALLINVSEYHIHRSNAPHVYG